MPLRGNKAYSPELQLPPLIKPSDEVWVIRFTGEVFVDYRLYVEKLQQYTQRHWRCERSDQPGLTFEEALASEERGGATNGKKRAGGDEALDTEPSSSQTDFIQVAVLEINIKKIVSKILRATGAHGASTWYLLQRLRELKVKTPWSNPKAAKTAFYHMLTHDSAFLELERGHFALKEITETWLRANERVRGDTPSQDGSTCSSQRPRPSDCETSSAPNTFDRNGSKCSKCHKTYATDCSPLLLCDSCPRVLHLACSGLSWLDVPPPDHPFHCPKCQTKGNSGQDRDSLNMTEEEWEMLGMLDREEKEKLRAEFREGRSAQMPREESRQRYTCSMDDLEVMEDERRRLWRMERIRQSMRSTTSTAPDIDLRIAQAKLRIEGPTPLSPMVSGRRALISLMDALLVVEFLSTFWSECETDVMSIGKLYSAVVAPTEGNTLAELYVALLRCVLLDQVGQTGTTRSRARRWARVIDLANWPEILRRYLLASREAMGLLNSDVHSLPLEDMDDQQIALRAAKDLESKPYYKFEPELHLRLLHTLCNDVINCHGMREAMAGRMEETTRLQAAKYHADAEERRKERQRKQLLKKGKRKHLGPKKEEGTKRVKGQVGERTNDGVDAADGEAEALNGDDEGIDAQAAAEKRKEREEVYRVEVGKRRVRVEPCGFDRHHQRYWWFRGFRSCLCVESHDGSSLGCITKREALDDLISRLNERGARELALSKSLKRVYDKLVESLSDDLDVVLDVTQLKEQKAVAVDGSKQGDTERKIVRTGVGHLESLVNGLATVGVELDGGIQEWRRQFRTVGCVPELSSLLSNLEERVGQLADGLPKGADNAYLGPVVEEDACWEEGDAIIAVREFDDSDTEDQSGGEGAPSSRSTRRSSLWRTAHERFVWLKGMSDVKRTASGCLGAYLSAILNDRAQPLIHSLGRKQEAAAKAAKKEAQAQAARSRKVVRAGSTSTSNGVDSLKGQKAKAKSSETKSEGQAAVSSKVPRKRRREPAKQGVKESGAAQIEEAQLPGKPPKRVRSTRASARAVPGGLRTRSMSKLTPESDRPSPPASGKNSAGDRWDYTCSKCGNGGKMLCCEASTCTVAMHVECIGLAKVPNGKWYCPNCAEKKPTPTRTSRRVLNAARSGR